MTRTIATAVVVLTLVSCVSTSAVAPEGVTLPEIEACPDTTSRPQVCDTTKPCPMTYGVWMDKDTTADFTCAVNCCKGSQERLRALSCPAPWKTLGVAVLIGVVAGMSGVLYFQHGK